MWNFIRIQPSLEWITDNYSDNKDIQIVKSVQLHIIYVITIKFSNSMNGFSLNQFGAVMKFAIELESELADYYENRQMSESHAALKGELSSRAKASLKRKNNIERSRRENVTEITLEPIEGLDSKNYVLILNEFTNETINQNEQVAVKFFSEAGPKINVLETRRLFKRCFKEHSNLEPL